jgi:hypothetical protein
VETVAGAHEAVTASTGRPRLPYGADVRLLVDQIAAKTLALTMVRFCR